jgi:hypothetical protein
MYNGREVTAFLSPLCYLEKTINISGIMQPVWLPSIRLYWLPSFGAGIKKIIYNSNITCLAATELVMEFI